MTLLSDRNSFFLDLFYLNGAQFLPGAVITARHFLHPVSIARKIMDESPHCALSGEGARKFADTLENFDGICNPEDLKATTVQTRK